MAKKQQKKPVAKAKTKKGKNLKSTGTSTSRKPALKALGKTKKESKLAKSAKSAKTAKLSAGQTSARKASSAETVVARKTKTSKTEKSTQSPSSSSVRPPTRVSIPAPKSPRKSPAPGKLSEKVIFFFAPGEADGDAGMVDELGGKGAGLAGMAKNGLPVPPGFTISTEVCNVFYGNRMRIPPALKPQMKSAIARIEDAMERKFGGTSNPLLVSVRSGARYSMPGMMDTVLNLGLNSSTLEALITETDNPRFAHDCYRRFIQMFSHVVLGMDADVFEDVVTARKKASRVKRDSSLTVDNLKDIIKQFKRIVQRHTREPFPEDPWTQLWMTVEAVFNSWNNPRAITYRRLHDISSELGTACNVQAMVFGNTGDESATGVGFTRNPSTGVKEFYGEFLTNAQGEDVVAGVRTPRPMSELKDLMPDAYRKLKDITTRLERQYRDIQDFEFTIQDGRLYMLQTRTGKRTAQAAVKIAVDMVSEGLINRRDALMRIDPNSLDQILHPHLDPECDLTPIAQGLPASPGAVTGQVAFTVEDAIRASERGDAVILVRKETNPDDIMGMAASVGILTARGGMTSHAAVVARGMGKCCVAGVEALRINLERKTFTIGPTVIRDKQVITLDGSTGAVYAGEAPTIELKLSDEFSTLMKWADKTRKLGVYVNADTAEDTERAVRLGAEGVGLCRSEHMFFAPERLAQVRQMILAETAEERQLALNKLLPHQRNDFKGIFRAMDGKPVIIRTLDPPLHEFLPKRSDVLKEIAELKAKEDDVSYEESLAIRADIEEKEKMIERLDTMIEVNPMLGHRGCRLGITYPEITEMQAKAIFTAACDVTKEGITVRPEVMIPLVGHVSEFVHQRDVINRTAEDVFKKRRIRVDYKVGAMIEVPRAALTADQIAKEADFFSFGTNDLTQMTLGFSRDDSSSFLKIYVEKGVLKADPFVSLDLDGVGQLFEIATQRARSVKPKMSIGVCGEHGGDPATIAFCHRVGLSYVSCSPYRVPIARLAAAQAAIIADDK